LSGHSYEKLRPLHKTAGYTCITTSVLHAGVYLSAWSEKAELENMRETQNLAGGIAGLAMVIIGFSTIRWFARRFYEGIYLFLVLEIVEILTDAVFYMIHIVLFILILIMIAMHRPLISKSTVVIIIFTASMWFSDRLLRFAKLCWYFPGNHATVKIMPGGALRVSLSRSMRRSRPGSHAYLWIPAIRCLETHPFTLVSQDPTAAGEFLISVYDGFTHDLRKRVSQEPDKSLRCSVDGPYGQVPDFNDFDRVLLVSGGSGASFAFAVALDVIKKHAVSDSTATKMIDFVWSVRHYG
jgi:predicted ferric reductase